MKSRPGSGLNLNGRLCGKQLQAKELNGMWLQGTHLYSGEPTGNSIRMMPMMKIILKTMRDLQHSLIQSCAQTHVRNSGLSFLKTSTGYMKCSPTQDHMVLFT